MEVDALRKSQNGEIKIQTPDKTILPLNETESAGNVRFVSQEFTDSGFSFILVYLVLSFRPCYIISLYSLKTICDQDKPPMRNSIHGAEQQDIVHAAN